MNSYIKQYIDQSLNIRFRTLDIPAILTQKLPKKLTISMRSWPKVKKYTNPALWNWTKSNFDYFVFASNQPSYDGISTNRKKK